MGSSWRDFGSVLRVVLRNLVLTRWHRQKPVTMGKSLVGQLLLLNQQARTRILRETALVGLTNGPDGTILGARVIQGCRGRRIRAQRGVLLVAGGFARSQEMREKSGPSMANTD